eukprot:gene10248-biopygen6184
MWGRGGAAGLGKPPPACSGNPKAAGCWRGPSTARPRHPRKFPCSDPRAMLKNNEGDPGKPLINSPVAGPVGILQEKVCQPLDCDLGGQVPRLRIHARGSKCFGSACPRPVLPLRTECGAVPLDRLTGGWGGLPQKGH